MISPVNFSGTLAISGIRQDQMFMFDCIMDEVREYTSQTTVNDSDKAHIAVNDDAVQITIKNTDPLIRALNFAITAFAPKQMLLRIFGIVRDGKPVRTKIDNLTVEYKA